MLVSILAKPVANGVRMPCVLAIVLLCTPSVAAPTDAFGGGNAAHVPVFASSDRKSVV